MRGQFRIIDNGTLTPEDWKEARRIGERVPRNQYRRQLLKDLTPEEIVEGMSQEQLLAALSSEQLLARLFPEQLLAALPSQAKETLRRRLQGPGEAPGKPG